MNQSDFDPEARLLAADEILNRAADQLLALLKEAAAALQPFPPFPGALFTYGVEVEPEGVRDHDVGCVVVTEEGDLKELQIGIDAEGLEAVGGADPIAMRDERLVDLELAPYDRLLYAYNGLRAVVALLRDRTAADDRKRSQT